MMKWSAYQAFSLVAFFFTLFVACSLAKVIQKKKEKRKKK